MASDFRRPEIAAAEAIIKRGLTNLISRFNYNPHRDKFSTDFKCDFKMPTDETSRLYRILLSKVDLKISEQGKIEGARSSECKLVMNNEKDRENIRIREYTINLTPELYFDLCLQLDFNPRNKLSKEQLKQFKEYQTQRNNYNALH
jgi:hypothetical protein